MKINIIRGQNQIGGSIIEISTDKTKIVFDVGINLNENEKIEIPQIEGLFCGEKKYDAVLNDAFSGEVPVGTMATVEAAKIIKNSLKDDGVYMSNVLGAVEGDKGKFLRAEVKTLQQVFKHVYVIAVYKNPKPERYVNWMVVATDNDKYTPNDIVDVRLTDDDIILTDDYNPVDSLVMTNYFE